MHDGRGCVEGRVQPQNICVSNEDHIGVSLTPTTFALILVSEKSIYIH